MLFITSLSVADSWLPELAASLSVFHALSTISLIAILYFLGSKRWIILAGVLFVTQVLFITSTYYNSDLFTKASTDEVLTLAQYNVHRTNPAVKHIVDWLEENHDKFDIVFLQEVNQDMKRELERLNKYYPYKINNTAARWFGRAFFSKIPIVSYRVEFFTQSLNHYLELELNTRQGKKLKFYGLHTTAPISPGYVNKRNHELSEMAKLIAQDDSQYMIVAGDFNTTPYSTAFRSFIRSTGFKKPRVHTGTWPSFVPISVLRMQIDHCLVSKQVDYLFQEIGTDKGSDHLPLITSTVLRS